VKKLDILEKILYYWACIITLGSVWLIKVIIKKAIIEATQEDKSSS
jgi:hypothetical protein